MSMCEQRVRNLQFSWSFNSGSLQRVSERERKIINDNKTSSARATDYNISLWLRADCQGTEFVKTFRTWFYFSVKGWKASETIHFRIENMNRQLKLFRMGFTPVFRIQKHDETYLDEWKRISHTDVLVKPKGCKELIIEFSFTFPEIIESESGDPVAYFAFTYPYSCDNLDYDLNELLHHCNDNTQISASLCVGRELLGDSLLGRGVELLKISDSPVPALCGDVEQFKLPPKPMILFTARVHPGETNSSFVMRGILKYLMDQEDTTAAELRRRFIFLCVPMLNPDGVTLGYHRTDSRGVNLNRVYNDPSSEHHPVICSLMQLVRRLSPSPQPIASPDSQTSPSEPRNSLLSSKISTESTSSLSLAPVELTPLLPPLTPPPMIRRPTRPTAALTPRKSVGHVGAQLGRNHKVRRNLNKESNEPKGLVFPENGLAMYFDLHGHVSKPGAFLYGNYFRDPKLQIETLTLARTMSQQCHPFFVLDNCVFSRANMVQKDKIGFGSGKEGSGRVAIYSATGLTHCYTLECNYYGGTFTEGVFEKKFEFTPENYELLGQSLLQSLLLYSDSLSEILPSPVSPPVSSARLWAQSLVHRQRIEKRFRRSRSRPKNDENKCRRRYAPTARVGRAGFR